MNLGLMGRVVIVTGSSRGIGKATALSFGAEGALVAVTYHESRERAVAAVEDIERAGGQGMTVQLDLAAVETINAATQSVLDRWGRIDVLVNNAVMWGDRLPWNMPAFEDIPSDEWRRMLRGNTEGHYAAIQAVLPAMRSAKWGRIVNVSSGIAVDGLPGAGAYGAAKAALHGLTRTLSKELGPAGVLVNTVMGGVTLTENALSVIPDAVKERLAAASPIRRLLAPEDVAPTIVYLCSAANTAVTGEIVRASGGIT